MFRTCCHGLFIFRYILYGFIGTQWFALGAIFGFLIFNLGIIGNKGGSFWEIMAQTFWGFSLLLLWLLDHKIKLWPQTCYCFMACCNSTSWLFRFNYKKIERVSPFDADRDHLHHRFMDAGYTQKTLIVIIFVASVVSLFGIIIEKFVPVYF